MPNRNYEKGRRGEYYVKNFLEKHGFKVLRTAGSHSPIDLLAARDGESVYAIQVKSGSIRNFDENVLNEYAKCFHAEPTLVWNNKGDWVVFLNDNEVRSLELAFGGS